MCGLNMTMMPDAIHDMNLRLRHRGLPGRTSTLRHGKFWLGHVRLPIQGLDERYDQPFEDDRWIMLYVGEVYDYKKLYPEENSDVPAMLSLWRRYGPRLFLYSDCMYSAIFVDKDTDTTWILTDPLAKKPLYMHEPTGSVSSELKALIPVVKKYHKRLGTSPKINELYFSSVEKWGYHFSTTGTPVSGIVKIPPGSAIALNEDGDLEEVKTISLPGIPLRPNIRHLLEQAVKNRLTSDVPIGVLASGGLDSTIVLKLALQHRTGDTPITVFHIDNGEEEYLDMLGLPSDVNVVKIGRKDLGVHDLKQILWANESPFDLGSMVPQYQLGYALMSRGFHVVLTGDGADELFGGYRRIDQYDSQKSDVFEELVHYHLPRLDRLMMAHTVELRTPFLAWDVVVKALGLPYDARVHKLILKQAFQDLVPGPILQRKKKPLKSEMVVKGGLNWSRHLSIHFRTQLERKLGI